MEVPAVVAQDRVVPRERSPRHVQAHWPTMRFVTFKEMSMPLPVSRTGNPGLNEKTFSGLPRPMASGERMTLQGSINKSFLLLVVLMAGAFWPWSQYLSTGDASMVGPS